MSKHLIKRRVVWHNRDDTRYPQPFGLMAAVSGSHHAEETTEAAFPDSLIGRAAEWNSLTAVFSNPGTNVHIHGPRGSGKSVVAQTAIESLPDHMSACYIPCTVYDTQYQALKKLYEEVTNEQLSDGYHTSHLQLTVSDELEERNTVVILDEIDFLLLNDGEDLLYYLSRCEGGSITVVTISANYPNLAPRIDDRTYSSLHPHVIQFEPYSEPDAARIIKRRVRDALHGTDAHQSLVRGIVSNTTNIRLGLHWLAVLLKRANGDDPVDLVEATRQPAVQSYRETLLSEFTDHHRLILQAIEELAENEETLMTGQVYDKYGSLCGRENVVRLTNRRISDFLKHLELLGVIQADYSYGGPEGKTRKIQLGLKD